jgi:hypothetical protein
VLWRRGGSSSGGRELGKAFWRKLNNSSLFLHLRLGFHFFDKQREIKSFSFPKLALLQFCQLPVVSIKCSKRRGVALLPWTTQVWKLIKQQLTAQLTLAP